MPKPNILLVEDVKIIVLDLTLTLTNLGYNVLASAATGEEALKLAANPALDLVLMDIKLAGEMDGISAATQIKERYNLPVVYLTGYADQTILDQAKISEPYGYILKPYTQRDLQISLEITLFKHKTEQEVKRLAQEAALAKYYDNLSRLIGGVVHNFNNLLTIILGNLVLTETMVTPQSELALMLAEIETAAQKARQHIQKLSLFTNNSYQPQLIKLSELMQDVLQNVDLHTCQIENAITNWEVQVDVLEMGLALENIIQNALEAMPEGGKLKLTTEKVANFVLLEISDEGSGIAPENLEKVFEPYFSTKSERDGLGLTLAMAIIIRNKGKLAVKTTAGIGTTMQVYLPT
jgi:signal transduction histidine kinase